MTNHPALNDYIVRVYRGTGEYTYAAKGRSADVVLDEAMGRDFDGVQALSITSRHQMSPVASDRDNSHAQFDAAGRSGIAVRRAETNLNAAEHRNDVEVARKWVSEGRALADLQRYGGYRSVTERDL